MAKGCPIPVVVAGGPRMATTRDLLAMAKDSIDAGGIAIGRNVFQAEDPKAMVCALAKIVHEGYSV